MNLFINAVTQSGVLILFDEDRQIISEKKIEILGNECSKLVTYIDSFLHENNTTYIDIEHIVVVNGPGSFTGVRTIVLAVNTINYIIQKNIVAINFFDLFEKYPIIKSSSKRDLFVKYKKNAKIEIIKNDEFLEKVKNNKIIKFYGDIFNNFIGKNIVVTGNINYEKVISEIVFQENKIIEPLYIKKPNIS